MADVIATLTVAIWYVNALAVGVALLFAYLLVKR